MKDPVRFARKFATAAHEDAGSRYDGGPYVNHLDDVVDVLTRYGLTDDAMLAAGYLHDVVEDTDITQAAIKEIFGGKVAGLVGMVSDGPEPTRAARKAAMLDRLALCGPRAIALKLADRIANVAYSKRQYSPQFRMYQKEQAAFRDVLRPVPEWNAEMWKELEGLLA